MIAVHKDDSGRRNVQVEVEVPGAAEEVWRAISTAAGISSWFVPTTTEYDAEGKPVRMTSDFGPGMESIPTEAYWDGTWKLNDIEKWELQVVSLFRMSRKSARRILKASASRHRRAVW